MAGVDSKRERILRIEQYEQALDFAQRQVLKLTNDHPNLRPCYTEQGKWDHQGDSWTNWCDGFPAGMMWLFYEMTKDDLWKDKAVNYSKLIIGREYDRDVHDLGFLFWSSWKRWFDLTGDNEIKEVVLQAGRTQALRYQKGGKYLASFIGQNSTFIDIMMNIGIIFYAAAEDGDQDLRDIALQHCMTTRKYLVRGDGSTAHEGIFSDEGEFLREGTHQGWRPDSSWARGQAWAIYGFGTAYSFANHEALLTTAEQCADFYIERTPGPGVPPNDWDEPSPTNLHESSAAAIAAGGFWRLARLTQSQSKTDSYREIAFRIMDALTGTAFLAIDNPDWEGILMHGTYHENNGLGVDESVMWGEYFFVETLSEMLKELRVS